MLNRITQLALLIAATMSFGRAEVITVTFSAQGSGSALANSSGEALPTGSLVRLGYFDDISDSSIVGMQGNVSLLDEFFTVVAEAMVGFFGGSTILEEDGTVKSFDPGSNEFPADGAFAHVVTFDPVPLERDGDRLVLWAFNSDTIATATEMGIFADDEWVTPSSLTLFPDVRSVDPETDLYVAVKGPEVSELVGGEFNKLVPIPEPSTGALALLGLTGLVLKRRRRQS